MTHKENRFPELTWSFQTTVESRRDMLLEVADRIMLLVQALPCVPNELDDVRLALVEALSNAVIHGNREDPGKTVGICGGCDERSQLLIAVTDQGDGFDPELLPDPTATENVGSSHGRGVFLMKRFVDDVEFHLGGRQVVLRKRISAGPRLIGLPDGAMRTCDR